MVPDSSVKATSAGQVKPGPTQLLTVITDDSLTGKLSGLKTPTNFVWSRFLAAYSACGSRPGFDFASVASNWSR